MVWRVARSPRAVSGCAGQSNHVHSAVAASEGIRSAIHAERWIKVLDVGRGPNILVIRKQVERILRPHRDDHWRVAVAARQKHIAPSNC